MNFDQIREIISCNHLGNSCDASSGGGPQGPKTLEETE